MGYCCSRVQKYIVYLSKYSIKLWQTCTLHPVGGALVIYTKYFSKPDRNIADISAQLVWKTIF